MPDTGVKGLNFYVWVNNEWRFVNSARPKELPENWFLCIWCNCFYFCGMIGQLYYEIADHRFLVVTSNPEVTASLIPSFQPFRVNGCGEPDLLLRFTGDCEIPSPEEPPVEVVALGDISFKIYDVDGNLVVVMTNGSSTYRMRLSPDRREVLSNLTLTNRGEGMFLVYFLRIAFAIASAAHKTVKLHGSVIEKGGKALVFLGRSGTGKSTHSRLWKKFVPGCTLLNDDEPIVRVMEDGGVRVYGAPWSGSTPCYRNVSAGLSAFVHLYQHPENSLSRLTGVKAFASLFQSAAILRSDKKNREQVMSVVSDILEKVPVYRLDNRPDREAVSLTETLID